MSIATMPRRSLRPSSALLSPGDLRREDFVTVEHIPILDAHSDDRERGVVDEPMLRRIARNSNARVASGDPPSLILGHTRAKSTTEEISQPPLVGFASGFFVDEYNGRPCLYCTFHFRKADHRYASSFPYRSVERLDSPHDYIDRIALLRTPPQRDLGVVRHERTESSSRRIRYGRTLPTTPPFTRSQPMPTAAAHDRRIRGIIGQMFTAHYEYTNNRRSLESMRDDEGIRLTEEEIERVASLPRVLYQKEADTIRKRYARRRIGAFGRVIGVAEEDQARDRAIMRKAITLLPQHNNDYASARAAAAKALGC